MITVKTLKYIDLFEGAEDAGIKDPLHKLAFLDECCNDSYTFLDLSDDRIEDLREEIAYNENKFNERYVQKCENEIKFINHLRAQGLTDGVMVWVSW